MNQKISYGEKQSFVDPGLLESLPRTEMTLPKPGGGN